MSADRELLELAAKAAGINLVVQVIPHRTSMYGSETVYRIGGHACMEWNPLKNAGVRYQLAKNLGLCVDFAECTVWKRLPDNRLIQEYWGGDFGEEARAIVRAAAEIGREMMESGATP